MAGLAWWTKLVLGAIFVVIVGFWTAPYFVGDLPLNPVWLTIGPVSLYWYGLLMTVAVFSCFGLAFWLNQKLFHLNSDNLFYALVGGIVSGFIGARLMFVILEWPLYQNNLDQIWQIHQGGMSIHGALLGGLVGLWFASRTLKLDFAKLLDLVAVGLPLGQAIGRWGNFFNQEAFGGPTQLPWKMYVAPQFRPTDVATAEFFHPTFLYESLGNLVIFYLLWRMVFRRPPAGSIVFWYLLLYSGWRFVMEYFRVDSQAWGSLTIAQWASLAIIVVVVILLNRRKHHEH